MSHLTTSSFTPSSCFFFLKKRMKLNVNTVISFQMYLFWYNISIYLIYQFSHSKRIVNNIRWLQFQWLNLSHLNVWKTTSIQPILFCIDCSSKVNPSRFFPQFINVSCYWNSCARNHRPSVKACSRCRIYDCDLFLHTMGCIGAGDVVVVT